MNEVTVTPQAASTRGITNTLVRTRREPRAFILSPKGINVAKMTIPTVTLAAPWIHIASKAFSFAYSTVFSSPYF